MYCRNPGVPGILYYPLDSTQHGALELGCQHRGNDDKTMTVILWPFIVACLSILVEIRLANWNILFSGAAFVGFYVGVSTTTQRGLIAAAVCCLSVEVMFLRRFTALPLLVPLFFFIRFWRTVGDRTSLLPQVVSGALIGFVYVVYTAVTEPLAYGVIPFGGRSIHVTTIATGVVTSAIVFYSLIAALDAVAGVIDMPQFQAKRRVGH